MGPAGPQGSQGPPGPQGPAGSGGASATIIPFASGRAIALHSDSYGAPKDVAAIGFGNASTAITISSSGQISPPSDANTAFSLPFDAVIDRIYFTLANSSSFTVPSGTTILPYIQLYVAAPGSGVFTPIPGARVAPSANYYGVVTANATRSASQGNINITLTAGMRILIGGMLSATGIGALSVSDNFYFTGGISLLAV
jgi:hypothetical protein